MRARLIVFPIKGRNWCFSRCVDAAGTGSGSGSESAAPSPKLGELWRNISSGGRSTLQNVETVVDFLADKMNRTWIGLEKAPPGSMKNRLHSIGLQLLSRVKPSEIFLKSVTKDVSSVEIMYPESLNPRLVRRRLRHIAIRGASLHKKYLYGSVLLIPLTSILSVLPLPNIPFFWVSFRAYSNWRALQGSERLLPLVSDCSIPQDPDVSDDDENKLTTGSNSSCETAGQRTMHLEPSGDLDRLLGDMNMHSKGIDCATLSRICDKYGLNKKDVLKYRDSQ